MQPKRRDPKFAEPHPMPCFIKELRAKVRDGSKTRTRRVAKWQPPREDPEPWLNGLNGTNLKHPWPPERDGKKAPYGEVGEVLYLREPLVRGCVKINGRNVFVAFYLDDGAPVTENGKPVRWRWKRKTLPQIHMPKAYARSFVKLTMKRGEWLQECSDEEAALEGVAIDDSLHDFKKLWDSINDKPRRRFGWATNPFVYVYGWAIAEGYQPPKLAKTKSKQNAKLL